MALSTDEPTALILSIGLYVSNERANSVPKDILAICAGYSPVTGEFSAQRPVTRSFDVFFDLRLNKRLSK